MSLKINQDNLMADISPYQKMRGTNIYDKIVKSRNYLEIKN